MSIFEDNQGGTIVKIIKEHCSITQSEIADKLGVTKSYVSQLAVGKRDLTLTKFFKLCEKIECDPVEIIELFIQKVKQ